MPLTVNNQILKTDPQGYLSNFDDWSIAVADAIAEMESIGLTENHWEVIHFVRDFYKQFGKSPAMRPLVKYLKQQMGEDKGNSLYLASLFPGGVAKQSTKLAGLPKPARCI